MPIGAAIGAAIGSFGGIGAHGDAGKARIGAYQDVMQYYQDAYGRAKDYNTPYIDTGRVGLDRIGALGKQGYFDQQFGEQDIFSDPSYRFRYNQGLQAQQAAANARGGYGGGGTLAALQNYGQQAASQEYQNAFQRFQDARNHTFNRLSGIAAIGERGVSRLTDADKWTTAGRAGARVGLGNAHANAILGAADARAAGYTQLGSAVDQAFGLATGTGYGNYFTRQQNQADPGFIGPRY